jgi:hypothetical protein
MKSETYLILCKAVVTVLFCALLYSLLVSYMQQTATLDKTLYDVKNITASDFTVELDITEAMYEDFLTN